MNSKSKMIPVLILNMGYSGLGIARNLYKKGMKIYGLTAHPNMPAAKTRFCDQVFRIPDSRDNPEELLEHLIKIVKKIGEKCIIFPTRDDDVLFLAKYKSQLSSYLIIPQPGLDILQGVMDKFELAKFAKQAGVLYPRTFLVKADSPKQKLPEQFEYPIIVKPRMSIFWRRQGNWNRVGAQKAILVNNDDELHSVLARIQKTGADAILQQFIAGGDQKLVSCCCYINREKHLTGYFCSRKVVQSPPLTGTGCVVTATDLPEIVDLTANLLKTCNYYGIAEVEYKLDETKNEYQLIEINPRHWDQHELGNALGVNLTWAIYADYAGIAHHHMEPVYKGPINWIAERELYLEIARRIFTNGAKISNDPSCRQQEVNESTRNVFAEWNIWRKELKGKKIWAGLKWNDPATSIRTIFKIIEDAIIRVWRHILNLK